MSIKSKIKSILPIKVWTFIRSTWFATLKFLESLGPRERTYKYLGINILYNRGNSLIKRLKTEQVFEEEMCKKITKDLLKNSKPILVDIGANIGLISAYILGKVPNVKIYAFEPGPRQAELLEFTIKNNLLSEKLFLNKVALSNIVGRQKFFTNTDCDQAKDGLVDTGRGEKKEPIEVTVTTLDKWWFDNGKPKIDVLKIDTEGSELLVLEGAKKILEEVKPVIYFEMEPSNLKVYPYSSLDIINFMQREGYNIETITGNKVTATNLEFSLSEADTFVAIPFLKSITPRQSRRGMNGGMTT